LRRFKRRRENGIRRAKRRKSFFVGGRKSDCDWLPSRAARLLAVEGVEGDAGEAGEAAEAAADRASAKCLLRVKAVDEAGAAQLLVRADQLMPREYRMGRRISRMDYRHIKINQHLNRIKPYHNSLDISIKHNNRTVIDHHGDLPGEVARMRRVEEDGEVRCLVK
jgi:hypothetical protein